MAGTVPGFPADEVRAGLRLAMSVGLPPALEDRPAFFFPPVDSDPGGSVDESGVPFSPVVKRVRSTPTPVRVPCAIEYFDRSGKIESFGVIQPSKAVLTLLDEDYAAIKGFQFVVIGGNRYFYDKTETPLGLDVVGVFIVHTVAEDQV